MLVIVDDEFRWKKLGYRDLVIYFKGDEAAVVEIAQKLQANINNDTGTALTAARAAKGHFALIVKGPGYTFASVDHCRSIPVFYVEGTSGNGDVLSNNARAAKKAAGVAQVDRESVVEASMAGFVSGHHTLYKDLKQLQAGELLWYDQRDRRVSIQKYYCYEPSPGNDCGEGELIQKLSDTMHRAFERVIQKANGRKIYVPLSAGLDSRFVVCKLFESGYRNIATFSYGPVGNDEAAVARAVARKLGVPWTFYSDRSREMCRLYKSRLCSAYGDFADGLSAAPNLQDFLAVQKLVALAKGSGDGVIVNGQTGDFISGGHIPKSLWHCSSPTVESLFSAVVEKHYSLWTSLKTPDNLASLRKRFGQVLDLEANPPTSKKTIIGLYEQWEYQERQAKFIVNGQRAYEFLGIDWALPFWDREVVDFWRAVPQEYKFNQKLYKQYLETWNFEKLFLGWTSTVWQWPGAMKAVLPILRLTRLVLGRGSRDWLLKRLLFFGMYRHQYAPFGLRYFIKHAGNLRNPISLISRKWLVGLGLKHGVQ